MSRKVPRQGIDLNSGVYGTPDDFLAVVKSEFEIVFDLASTDENCIVPAHFTIEDDALSQPWYHEGWNWLNPPFDDIGAWAKKCWDELQENEAQTLLLVPASVGSNWYRDYVYDKAQVRFLNGRLTFKGHTQCYPKDLLLAIYDPRRYRYVPSQYPWNWRSALQCPQP